jgi:hypothetical protein
MLKTLSFAAVHFHPVAFTIGYLRTGSVLVGGTLALVEPACNTIAITSMKRSGRAPLCADPAAAIGPHAASHSLRG